MARPIEGNYFEGAVCKKCRTTTRYIKGRYCVECARRQNAKKFARRMGKVYDPGAPETASSSRISKTRLHHAMGYFENSVAAFERGRRLDNLINARFAKLLGKNPEAEPTMTGGDAHRARLPVGWTNQSVEHVRDQDRADTNAMLRTAIEDIFNSLPDLVTFTDVADRLPKDIMAALGTRANRQITKELRPRKETTQHSNFSFFLMMDPTRVSDLN